MKKREEPKEEDEDEIVCLDESFFINDDYELTTFTFGSQVLQLFCLQSASTDFDLTGQLVWPGAIIMNNYLSKNTDMLQGCSIIELGSGVGITGILCRRFCRQILLTDHNDEVLKILNKNIELHATSESPTTCSGLAAEKLEWGNDDHLSQISEQYSGGFDLVLGADIYILDILSFPSNIYLTYFYLNCCKFILAYVSRTKIMDVLVIDEAVKHGMQVNEVQGTRSVVGNHEGVIYEITLP
ncbi:hypothetical protein FRX31_008667 [Thalictrum thalictroides]|uniref:Uncharacterized protein n=1 Tax=Thalictrum thalictroides TaxID=46969 RepID=A0A7J6WYW1_THATH|nr:hypothetical protein FRX31_008667 [Thalictrum thalictroides]